MDSCPQSAPGATEISVVLVVPNRRETALRTIQHFQKQTVAKQMEVILFVPSPDVAIDVERDLADFGAHQCLVWKNPRNLAAARAEGVRVARSPVVVHAEDHCYPEPEWAEHLIEAHREPHGAVGPLMVNANPDTLWSWAAFTLHFGHCAFPDTRGPCEFVATHNTSFKTKPLLELGEELDDLMEMELLLQERLKQRGLSIFHETLARTHHVNVSNPAASLTASFYGGWLFSTVRAREQHWTLGRRLFQLAVSPAVPLLQVKRRWNALRSIAGDRQILPFVLFVVLFITSMHTLGEIVGLLFPSRRTIERYSNFENTRNRFVRASERHLVEPAALSATPHESAIATQSV